MPYKPFSGDFTRAIFSHAEKPFKFNALQIWNAKRYRRYLYVSGRYVDLGCDFISVDSEKSDFKQKRAEKNLRPFIVYYPKIPIRPILV